MIIKVEDKKCLEQFIYFVKELYKDDDIFVYPIFSALKKELGPLVLDKKTYTAILCKMQGRIVGRLLFTVSESKQHKADIGYFSFFDCIDDQSAAQELFGYMEAQLKGKVSYVEGTFSPYDPDTRRGILVKGFDQDHTILTSYNYQYYETLVRNCGYDKVNDTFTVKVPLTQEGFDTVKALGEKAQSLLPVEVSPFKFSRLDKEIQDIHSILNEATTEINYQAAPSIEMITSFAKNMRFFLNPNLIMIAREKETGRPVGFCLALPDFNCLFKKSGGKIKPVLFLTQKNKINSARGVLQYVVPDYQKKGLITLIYYRLYQSFKALNISKFEGGTIMENNASAWGALVKLGGEVSKIYRILGKNL